VCAATKVTTTKTTKHYTIQNVLSKEKFQEEWVVFTTDSDPILVHMKKTTKTDTLLLTFVTTTVSSEWWKRVTKRYGFGEYYEEFLTVAPENLEPGMTGYGYLNTYDAKTETLTESSPVLMSAALENKKKKVTLSFYISNFRLMEVTQYYTKSEKRYPLLEDIKIYRPGIDPKTVPVVGNPQHYLETHLVISTAKRKH
jgi:hypothetical protein